MDDLLHPPRLLQHGPVIGLSKAGRHIVRRPFAHGVIVERDRVDGPAPTMALPSLHDGVRVVTGTAIGPNSNPPQGLRGVIASHVVGKYDATQPLRRIAVG